MTENLTKQYKDYAVYLPSLQYQYSNFATKKNAPKFNDWVSDEQMDEIARLYPATIIVPVKKLD